MQAFEEQFAAYCGTRHAVGTSSGLDALRLALLAAGARTGRRGGRPGRHVHRDVEAVTRPARARPRRRQRDATTTSTSMLPSGAIGPRTRALLPVHLYGQMADMRALASSRRRTTSRSSRMPARRTAPRGRLRAGAAAMQRLSASIRARTSARWATRAPSYRRRRSWRRVPARSASTASGGSTTTMGGLHGPAGHDPGDRARAQAPLLDELERAAREDRRDILSRARGRR